MVFSLLFPETLLRSIWSLCKVKGLTEDRYYFPPSVFLFRSMSHPLSSPLSSFLGCVPPLIGPPLLRSLLRGVLCGCLLSVSSVYDFVRVSWFLLIATMSFAGYFLVRSLLSAFPGYLRTYSRFDLVWFRLYLVTTAGFVVDQLIIM